MTYAYSRWMADLARERAQQLDRYVWHHRMVQAGVTNKFDQDSLFMFVYGELTTPNPIPFRFCRPPSIVHLMV
jgi:hypothetical protein